MSAHPSPPQDTDPVTFWESRYGESDAIWSGRPNAVLVREAGDLEPGHALDLGSGEGGDSLWPWIRRSGRSSRASCAAGRPTAHTTSSPWWTAW
jgi:hypothetical protein